MNYAESLRYLYSFIDWERGIGYGVDSPPRFTLDRISALLRILDNPHQRFASIHLAGSKGKGSTAAILESVLRAAGLRTGLYTQPHLHTFRERVRINNGPISPETFACLVGRITDAVETLKAEHPDLGNPTTYELATALGFLCFAEAAVDMAVVEVGLGGRLDATNVITPRVSVITSISLEHTAILGDTLAAIAQEKAGIVKQDGVLVHAPNPADVLGVFRETCMQRNARIIAADDSRCEAITKAVPHSRASSASTGDCPRIEYGSGSDSIEKPSARGEAARQVPVEPRTDVPPSCDNSTASRTARALPDVEYPTQVCAVTALGERREVRFPLRGRHQRINLSVALAVVDELAAQGLPVSVDAVCKGIEDVWWPGRFEQLSARPLVIADGAHTPDAMACLRETLAEHYSGRRILCVFGTNRDKSSDRLLEALLPSIDELVVTKSRHPRAQEPGAIAETAKDKVPATVAASVEQALAIGMNAMGAEDVLCVTGSLFVAAEAREDFDLAQELDPPLDLPNAGLV
ncbi:MAG: bifunctional folylpolyglutamate synthase/dihydrofolate synthase [Chloroflexota bacterium]|nr:bifunctional folylpolyglutamate synthase/dihydrofolate synthase [Chloroflexota bacterium]